MQQRQLLHSAPAFRRGGGVVPLSDSRDSVYFNSPPNAGIVRKCSPPSQISRYFLRTFELLGAHCRPSLKEQQFLRRAHRRSHSTRDVVVANHYGGFRCRGCCNGAADAEAAASEPEAETRTKRGIALVLECHSD
jgi:hypothetical protein